MAESQEAPRLTLTVQEASEAAGIGLHSMYEALRRKDFPSIRVGRRLLVPRVAFERILAGDTAD